MRAIAAIALVALCAAGLARAAGEDSLPRKIMAAGGDDPKPKPAVSCGDHKDKIACLGGAAEGDCAWCKGDFMPPSCVGLDAAKYLPETVAHCKLGPKHDALAVEPAAAADNKGQKGKKAKPPAMCGDNVDKHDCLHLGADEGECAWCSGGYMPATCMSAMASKYLPAMVATCKSPKKHRKADDADADDAALVEGKGKGGGADWPSGGGDWPSGGGSGPGGGGMGCSSAKGKKDCLKAKGPAGGCAWCEGGYGGGGKSCLDEMVAKYMPGVKCAWPKAESDDDDDAVAAT